LRKQNEKNSGRAAMENEILNFIAVLNLKAFLLVGLGLWLVRLIKNFHAKYRQTVWRYAIGLLILLPLLSLVLPAITISLPCFAPTQTLEFVNLAAENPSPFEESAQGLIADATRMLPAKDTVQVAVETASPNWPRLFIAVYCLVGFLLIIKLVAGLMVGYRYVNTMVECRDSNIRSLFNFDDKIKILINPNNETPFVWGFLKPAIVLPKSYQSYASETQRNVLCHELMHIHNQDWLWAVIGKLCCCLYWINPLVWFAIRSSNVEAEKICDEQVLSIDGNHEVYAEQLLHIAKTLSHRATATAMAPSMSRPSVLRTRIDNILTSRRRREMKPITQSVMKIAFLTISVLLIVINSQGQTPSNKQNVMEEPAERPRYVRLKSITPEYPKQAAKMGTEGYTVVEYDIQPSGKVKNIRIIESEPAGIFDQVSIAAVQQWLYMPEYIAGKAVETQGVRNQLSYKLDQPGAPKVTITPAELEYLEQQGPQTAEEALSIVKYYLSAEQSEQATRALLGYLNKVENVGAESVLALVRSVPVDELEQTPLEEYLLQLQSIAEKSATGDAFALWAQFYRGQKDWPSAQLALAKAFERGHLSDPATTTYNLSVVLYNTHSYAASLRAIDAVIAKYGENEHWTTWRNIVSAELERKRMVSEQLLRAAAS